MRKNMQTLIMLFCFTVMVSFGGAVRNQCGAATYDATGSWNYSTSNGWVNPGNAGCTPADSETGIAIVITQNEDTVTIVINGITYTGTVSGSTYTLSASYPYSGGTITQTNIITLSSSTSGSGTNSWSWISGTFNCNGGGNISITKLEAPGDMDESGRDDVIFDFGLGQGIWSWFMNSGTWLQIHPLSPESVTTGNIDGN